MSHVLKPRSTTAAASASVLKRAKMILAAWPGGVMIASVVESSACSRVALCAHTRTRTRTRTHAGVQACRRAGMQA
tara:strand:- start:483 stop:710 length:228 start_codon:yes stop_codon:yes gene_type:complete